MKRDSPKSNGELFSGQDWLIYSSESSEYIANALVKLLPDAKKGSIDRKVFDGGEQYYRIEMDERYDLNGKDVIYVSSTAEDSDLLELIRLGCAFAAYGARRRVFIIPFLGYSTMERQVKPGEVVTAKVNARLLSSIPDSKLGNLFLLLDLHVQGILQYFEGPTQRQELTAERLLQTAISEHLISAADPDQPRPIFASADLGRPLWVQSFAKFFKTGMAFVHKERADNETAVKDVIGEVKGRHVIIYDDMTRTGGSLINAAEAYLEKGAAKVSAVLSHLALAAERVVEKLEKSPISVIIATNSHPMSQHPRVQESKKFIIVDCTHLFANAIGWLNRE